MTKLLSALAAIAALASVSLAPAAAAEPMSGYAASSPAEHGMPAGGDGAIFTGTPDLNATISLVKLGGGPQDFSIAKALTAMVGSDVVTAEVTKLTRQYGKENVGNWLTVFDFSVRHAAASAMAAGVKFPEGDLGGKTLAARLVTLGVDGNDGTFYYGTLLDHIVTHPIHEATMAAIDAKYGAALDANYHRITNQALYDLAQALGAKDVKPAAFR
ncbi:MAG TPA: hypothetical protein VGN14_04755 [Candidatus Elarobacter sp.]